MKVSSPTWTLSQALKHHTCQELLVSMCNKANKISRSTKSRENSVHLQKVRLLSATLPFVQSALPELGPCWWILFVSLIFHDLKSLDQGLPPWAGIRPNSLNFIAVISKTSGSYSILLQFEWSFNKYNSQDQGLIQQFEFVREEAPTIWISLNMMVLTRGLRWASQNQYVPFFGNISKKIMQATIFFMIFWNIMTILDISFLNFLQRYRDIYKILAILVALVIMT